LLAVALAYSSRPLAAAAATSSHVTAAAVPGLARFRRCARRAARHQRALAFCLSYEGSSIPCSGIGGRGGCKTGGNADVEKVVTTPPPPPAQCPQQRSVTAPRLKKEAGGGDSGKKATSS